MKEEKDPNLSQQEAVLVCSLESCTAAILVVSQEGIQEHHTVLLFFPNVARTCSTIQLSISRSREILPDTLRLIRLKMCSLQLVVQYTPR